MPRVKAGDIELGWRQWGDGPTTVVFLHGNLASKDWIEASAPLFPRGIRVIGIDWRGCGDSDRPPADPDYTNYSMQQHAEDMLAALDTLNLPFCHLATHSTGGIIAARMLLAAPQRFGVKSDSRSGAWLLGGELAADVMVEPKSSVVEPTLCRHCHLLPAVTASSAGNTL